MSNIIAFPMYDIFRPATQAFGAALQNILVQKGLPARSLTLAWPQGDLLSHWRRDDLLLSQTCGYPLVTRLPEVQILGCFHYQAPGCEGFSYRSVLVAREGDKQKTLVDFRGRRAVCNAVDSQSGYNALLKMVAPLADHGAFFAAAAISGSHRESLQAIAQGTADIAAIDCVTWALLQRYEPALLRGLAVIGQSPLAPGLPLITARQTPPQTVRLLRDALRQLVSEPEYRALCAALLITRFSEVRREAYSALLAWRQEAILNGVTQL